MDEALRTAIEKAGSKAKLARLLGGITPQAIGQWRRAPVERVLALEKATGVTRYQLRPDIYGTAPEQAA